MSRKLINHKLINQDGICKMTDIQLVIDHGWEIHDTIITA